MSNWVELKVSARTLRQDAERKVGLKATLKEILYTAIELAQIDVESCPYGNPILYGGDARLEVPKDDCPAIYYRDDTSLGYSLFLIAHELAHARLHTGGFAGTHETFEPDASEEAILESATEPYSPRSLQERQANVWAREFLLPATEVCRRFLQRRITASEITIQTGLDGRLVQQQMARALLTIESESYHEAQRKPPSLNDRQQAAAHVKQGPLLVMAGPGTGKTSTLTSRVSYLLANKVVPGDIVCLTFSRKAAQEMRERIATQHPEQAPSLRIDTIHAYCCDILRREIKGEYDQVKVLDTPGQRAVLESLLPTLPLVHFQYLPDPPARLGEILQIIGRAKCDLVSPDEFMQRSTEQLEQVRRDGNEDAQHHAERIMEVAEVYQQYQARLVDMKYYDYGDLVVRTIELLREHPDVLARVREHKHLLVDEYQDLNAAGLCFVKLIAGEGKQLWAVGDPYQAIYRFNGASTSGILSFREQYPASPEPVVLDINYRSRQEIIDFFEAMPAKMEARVKLDDPPHWTSNVETKGHVIYRLAESPEAEVAGIARAIEHFHSVEGVMYLDQAVLARNHKHLALIAKGLEEAGVPVLFLSGFFEREVVRDLLALLEITTSSTRYHALWRVCSFPEYSVPDRDVRLLVDTAQQTECTTTCDVLRLALTMDSLSKPGRDSLVLLLTHIKRIAFSDHPWQVLADYLFEHSCYLNTLPPDDSTDDPVLNQRRRVALFQLLQIAHEYVPTPGKQPRRTFLDWVRRLASSSEYRHLAQVPPWAASINAVRLLTAHAAKGLEFEAVHVPMLNKWDFEKQPINPPAYPESLRYSSYEQDVTEEEQCLFFVAASRARRFLLLTRSKFRYNSRGKLSSASPSTSLLNVKHILPGKLTGIPHQGWSWRPSGTAPPNRTPLKKPSTYIWDDFNAYLDCPRRYYYSRVFGLHEKADPSPYLTLIRLVREAIEVAMNVSRRDEPLNPEDLTSQALAKWNASEFREHFYASHYEHELRLRINRISELIQKGNRLEFPSFKVSRPKGIITIKPDVMFSDAEGTHLRRWTAGAVHWSERQNPYYWLLHNSAVDAGISSPILESVSVAASHNIIKINLNYQEETATRVDVALEGLANGYYPPRPDDNRCPSCPFYFACQEKKMPD